METVNYTEEQLEQMLQAKKAEKQQQRQAERQAYEQKRDAFVKRVIGEAVSYHGLLKDFKADLVQSFEEFEKQLNEYGEIRKNSKGGFSITSSDGKHRVRRMRATAPEWDERSKKGEALIIEFLQEQITDTKIHKLVMSFLQRNEKGELEYSRVMNLLNMKADFDDPRWVEGLELMQESYNITLRAFQFEFQVKDDISGKWQRLEMNFSSI
jgi:ABC-type Fe3+/spermidine/putrescine transport system ATPase subunit